MDEIAVWIKKIIAILVLAGFLEMILPNNEMKGVTKMMMGLLIIMVMVQPVLRLFKLPATIIHETPALVKAEIPAIPVPNTGQIIKSGLSLRDDWIAGQKKHSRELLIDKVKAGIGLIDGVKLLEVKAELKDPSNNGDLTKLKLRLQLERPARIMADREKEERAMDRRIRDTIKLFTNLTDDRIEVNWDG
jgi:stage III sporulation protein AF